MLNNNNKPILKRGATDISSALPRQIPSAQSQKNLLAASKLINPASKYAPVPLVANKAAKIVPHSTPTQRLQRADPDPALTALNDSNAQDVTIQEQITETINHVYPNAGVYASIPDYENSIYASQPPPLEESTQQQQQQDVAMEPVVEEQEGAVVVESQSEEEQRYNEPLTEEQIEERNRAAEQQQSENTADQPMEDVNQQLTQPNVDDQEGIIAELPPAQEGVELAGEGYIHVVTEEELIASKAAEDLKKSIEEKKAAALAKLKEKEDREKEIKENEHKQVIVKMPVEQAIQTTPYYWRKVILSDLYFVPYTIQFGKNVGKVARKLRRPGDSSTFGEFQVRMDNCDIMAAPHGPFGTWLDNKRKAAIINASDGDQSSYYNINNARLEWKISNKGKIGNPSNIKIMRTIRTLDKNTKAVLSERVEPCELDKNTCEFFTLLACIEYKYVWTQFDTNDQGSAWTKTRDAARNIIMRTNPQWATPALIAVLDQNGLIAFKSACVLEMLQSNQWSQIACAVEEYMRDTKFWSDQLKKYTSDLFFVTCSRPTVKSAKGTKLTNAELEVIKNCPFRWKLYQDGYLYNGPVIATSSGQILDPFELIIDQETGQPKFNNQLTTGDWGSPTISIRPNPHKKNTVGFSISLDSIILDAKSVFINLKPIDEVKQITGRVMNGLVLPVSKIVKPPNAYQLYELKMIEEDKAADQAIIDRKNEAAAAVQAAAQAAAQQNQNTAMVQVRR